MPERIALEKLQKEIEEKKELLKKRYGGGILNILDLSAIDQERAAS